MNFWAWLENSSWALTILNTHWIYSVCEVSHFFSLFVLVGTAVLVDLRVLGVIPRGEPATQLAKRFFPWACMALGVVVLSGFLLFTTDALHYVRNEVFWVKLSAMLLAVISSLVVQAMASSRDTLMALPVGAKLVSVISLVLWIGTIIAAVEVPALTGVG
jgi:hypothetical protein